MGKHGHLSYGDEPGYLYIRITPLESCETFLKPELSFKSPVNKEAIHDIIKVILPLIAGVSSMKAKIKNDRADLFIDELVEGEDILWQGQPDTSKLFNRNDIALIPVTVLWGGFALYWNISIWGFNAPFFSTS